MNRIVLQTKYNKHKTERTEYKNWDEIKTWGGPGKNKTMKTSEIHVKSVNCRRTQICGLCEAHGQLSKCRLYETRLKRLISIWKSKYHIEHSQWEKLRRAEVKDSHATQVAYLQLRISCAHFSWRWRCISWFSLSAPTPLALSTSDITACSIYDGADNC